MTKLLDSPSYFSKFESFREPQLNTYLNGMQTRYLKKLFTKIIFIENILIKVHNMCIEFEY